MKEFIKYKNYYGSIYFDQENLIFYGKVEFIRSLITYEAIDAKGLKRAFEDAVEDYLDMCEKQHIKPEIPFKGSLNVRLGSKLHRDVVIEAKRKHLSVNKFIADTLNAAVGTHG